MKALITREEFKQNIEEKEAWTWYLKKRKMEYWNFNSFLFPSREWRIAVTKNQYYHGPNNHAWKEYRLIERFKGFILLGPQKNRINGG